MTNTSSNQFSILSLDELGIRSSMQSIIDIIKSKNSGVITFTGQPKTGKTTTMFSMALEASNSGLPVTVAAIIKIGRNPQPFASPDSGQKAALSGEQCVMLPKQICNLREKGVHLMLNSFGGILFCTGLFLFVWSLVAQPIRLPQGLTIPPIRELPWKLHVRIAGVVLFFVGIFILAEIPDPETLEKRFSAQIVEAQWGGQYCEGADLYVVVQPVDKETKQPVGPESPQMSVRLTFEGKGRSDLVEFSALVPVDTEPAFQAKGRIGSNNPDCKATHNWKIVQSGKRHTFEYSNEGSGRKIDPYYKLIIRRIKNQLEK